jgi:hypothetical protein
MSTQKIKNVVFWVMTQHGQVCVYKHSRGSVASILCSKYGASVFLQNVGTHLPYNVVSYSYDSALPWKPHISFVDVWNNSEALN